MLSPPVDVLALTGVGLRLRGQTLLDDVGFTLRYGERLIVLGASGAGKSLLLDAIAGNIPHTGTAVFSDAVSAGRRTFSYDSFATLGLLKVDEVLRFLEATYRAARNDRMVARLRLETILAKPVRVLSKGERKRLGVYCALFSDPTVAILDEPTDGMDPELRDAFWTLVKERRGATMLTTHLWEEAERFHDRIALMANGRLLSPPAPVGALCALHPYGGKVIVAPRFADRIDRRALLVDDRLHVFWTDDADKKAILGALGPDGIAAGYSILPLDLGDTYRLLVDDQQKVPHP